MAGVTIERRFTRAGEDPYALFEYEKRDSVIKNTDGSIAFEIEGVEVPKRWSQLATDILVQKYIRKAGVPQTDEQGKALTDEQGTVLGSERSVKQVVHRLAGCWRHWGERHGYFATEEDAQAFYDELAYMLLDQRAAPNSPQWFNTGLAWAYGITGQAQGHYYVDPESGELRESEDAYTRPQPHACAEYHTLLYTEEGMRFIGEIVEEEAVGLKVFDGERFVKILATKENGEKDVFRITLKNGNRIDLTADHLVLAAEKRKKEGGTYEWREVKETATGMRLQQPSLHHVEERNVFAEELAKARLAGWITGNGSVGTYQGVMRLEIITINEEEHAAVLSDIKEVFGEEASYWVTDFETESDLDGKRIHLSGKKIHSFVKEYDLRRKSKEAAVSARILSGSPQEKREYLKALFQADGCVRIRTDEERNAGDICLSTISEELSFGVLQLLNSLGIYSRISHCRDSREDRQTLHHVIISYGSAREQFQEQVGFLAENKQQKLALLNRIVTKSKSLPLIREEQILSIERLGARKVYDIQTESGKFLGNGIVVHNCFIQSLKDDLVNRGGIFDLAVREARVFKYGSGTGSNFSALRGRGEPLSGGGTSSGLMSFLKVFDAGAGAIKSGGTTRRAAKMVCLDMDHPEIETFIMWKYREEQKVADLVTGSRINRLLLAKVAEAAKEGSDWRTNRKLKAAIAEAKGLGVSMNYILRILQLAEQGIHDPDFKEFDTHYESEAYQTVSGQNANNSVRIPNAFLEAVERDGDWQLIKRTDGQPWKTLKARELWEQVCLAAWHSADPGVQYDTTINEWHTCPGDGRIEASNPCSEYMFLNDTACNLASLNVGKFLEEGVFDIAGFRHATRLWTIVLEISVLMAQFVSEEMALNSYRYRTLGLGYANIGSALMRLGIPYDSDEGRAFIGAVTALMGGQSYATSAELARELGSFERYEANRESMLRVIRNHKRAAENRPATEYEGLSVTPQGLGEEHGHEELVAAARDAWRQALTLGEQHGYRNAQVTVIAPTGTIGLVMDCDTTGIEPDFALVKFKKLAGGGYFKIINQSVPAALERLGYDEATIGRIVTYAVGHATLKGSPAIGHEALKGKGFTPELLEKVEKSLGSAFDITFVFNRFTLGDEAMEALGFGKEAYEAPDFTLLEALGFTKEEIARANEHVCGTMTLEGAPGLREEHLAVFDCASKCGKKGKRFLKDEAHIRAMAAAQPFISGAISKTINMPNEASLKEIGDAYLLSWKLMLKANALYRDGSKLSQPLNTVAEELSAFDEESSPESMHAAIGAAVGAPEWEGISRAAMIAGRPVAVTTHEHEDGSLGQVELAMEGAPDEYRGLLNAYSELVSHSLQQGVPLQSLVERFTFSDYAPGGPVQGDPAIRNATSVSDYLFRVLGHEYLGMEELVHVKAPPTRAAKAKRKRELSEEERAVLEAKAKGYTGETCGGCGSMRLKRNGTCLLCEECGSTSGCS